MKKNKFIEFFKKHYLMFIAISVGTVLTVLAGVGIGIAIKNNKEKPIVDNSNQTAMTGEEIWTSSDQMFNYLFSAKNSGYIITGFRDGAELESSYVNFPSSKQEVIGGVASTIAVVGIDVGAFENDSAIKGVSLPNNYKFVGANAFKNCENLVKLVIGANNSGMGNEISIGENAFCGNDKLESVEFWMEASEIGKNAFGGCNISTVYSSSSNICDDLDNKFASGRLFENATRLFIKSNIDVKNNEYLNKFFEFGESVILDNLAQCNRYDKKTGIVAATLNANGGRVGYEVQEAFLGENVELEVPIRENYTFLGWRLNSEDSEQAFNNMSGFLSDVTLVAKWEPTKYAISYLKYIDGEEIALNDLELPVQYDVLDDSFELTRLGIINGFEFVGWYLNDEGGVFNNRDRIERFDTSVGGNAKLCARYIKLFDVEDGAIVKFNGTSWAVRSVVITDDMYKNTVVNKIASNAFKNATTLSEITFLSNISEICDEAFINATNLRSVTFEETCGLEKIGARAFYGCTRLFSIKVPSTVTQVGAGAFGGCVNLNRVEYDTRFIYAIEDDTFNGCENLINLSLPTDVTRVGKRAFANNKNLGGNVISNLIGKLTVIGDDAFKGCIDLRVVTLNKDLQDLGAGVFSDCINLETLTFEDGFSLIEIEDNTFKNCNLKSIELCESIVRVGEGAFENNSELVDVLGLERIVEFGKNSFKNTDIELLTLNANVAQIGAGAFLNTKLNSVAVEDVNGWWASTNYPVALVADNEIDFAKPYSVAVWLKKNATKNIIHKRVFNVSGNTITGVNPDCVDAKNLVIGKEISTINENVLSTFNGLNCLAFADINGWTYIDDGDVVLLQVDEQNVGANLSLLANLNSTKQFTKEDIFVMNGSVLTGLTEFGATLKTITLNEFVTEIAESAFENDTNLETINIGYNVSKVGANAFAGCINLQINLVDNGYWYKVVGSEKVLVDFGNSELVIASLVGDCSFDYVRECLFVVEGTTIVGLTDLGKAKTGTLVLPNFVEKIGERAFVNSVASTIVIGENLSTIEKSAFENCTSLIEVELNNSASLNTISENAFAFCEHLAIIDLRFVKHIGSFAFAGTGLECIELQAVEYIGEGAFCQISALTSVVISGDENCLSQSDIFAFDINLSDVTLGSAIKIVGDKSFYFCGALENIDLSAVNVVGKSAFAYSGLVELNEIDALVEIKDRAFASCVNLTQVTFGDSLKIIGSEAFRSSGVTQITVVESVIEIGRSAFVNCNKLQTIDFEDVNNWDVYDYYTSINTYIKKPNYVVDLTNSASNAKRFVGLTSLDFGGCKLKKSV